MEFTKIVGGTTVKVWDGPADGARFPAKSDAVPAAILILKFPVPVIFEIVTVKDKPEPETPIVPVALPVEFKVMFEALNVLVLKLASV